MKASFFSGVRQGVSVRLFAGVFAVIVLIAVASVETLLRLFPMDSLLAYDYHTEFVINALRSDAVAPFLPVIAALPFASSYVEDINSKFVRYWLIRSSYKNYIFSRFITCFFWGALVVVIGIFATWITSALLFMPLEKAQKTASTNLGTLIENVGMLGMCGGFWAVVGMSMSSLMESRYIAYASPFVLYYLLVILYERYFTKTYIIYPREWMFPSDAWPFGGVSVAIWLIELTISLFMLFAFRAGRRIRQL